MPRILVVDDSRLSRKVVTRPLRKAGHEVREAANGQEGLAEYESFAPDCVVTDVVMPVMDGPTMLAKLRRQSDVPVIVVSTDIEDSMREYCASLGIRVFLNKPFKPQELLQYVDAVLNPLQSA